MKTTPEKAKAECIEKLKGCQANYDNESAHVTADLALCSFLQELGHWEIVQEFQMVDKWYS